MSQVIILTKSFHHNNLILQLIHDTHLDIYTINIHRDNDNSDHDIFGMFVTKAAAISKFETIRL